jgi:hypothetical protein
MPFDINGTTMSGGSNTFSVTTTDGGAILNTDAPGNVYAANWRKTGTTFGNGWTKLDMTAKSSGGYKNYSRFGKLFSSGASTTNFNIFQFTPSNGWTWYYMSMEAHNFAQNGTGYGKWIFPTNGGEGPGYAPGLSEVQAGQGGYQGSTAPTYSSDSLHSAVVELIAMEGAKIRLRPILMTSFAFIAGLIPLMLASGAGAIGNRTIGSAAAGGMFIGTMFGIIIVPGLYVVFAELSKKIKITTKKEENPLTEEI